MSANSLLDKTRLRNIMSQYSQLGQHNSLLSIPDHRRSRLALAVSIASMGVISWLFIVFRKWYGSANDNKSRFPRFIQSYSPDATDPPLLRKHSEFKDFKTVFSYYPSIRVFYRPHPHTEQIPVRPAPLPLLVFIHGLGGSVAQFNSLLSSLVDVAPCLAIDLPGCGRSKFAPHDWQSYSVEALVALLDTVIESYRTVEEGQDHRGVVLISHSLGSSFSALLASSTSPYPAKIREHVQGVIAICPKAGPPDAKQTKIFRTLLHVPGPLFDIFRAWDKRGGVNSESVQRFVGPKAGYDARKLQMRFNAQSRTPVWRRMAWGILPNYDQNGKASGGVPEPNVWRGIHVPTYLIAGEADAVTKPEEVTIISAAMQSIDSSVPAPSGSIVPDASTIHNSHISSQDNLQGSEEQFGLRPETSISENNEIKRKLKTTTLPSPAAHGMMYEHSTHRTVAGLIADFLSQEINPHLSLGWQLQHLTTSGKWDVKNLKKWQGVKPVSDPIGPREAPVFRALKTLRKQDEHHTPKEFVKTWKGKIFAIVDISHDAPVYDPAEIEAGGIHYHKFPTISKIPPTVQEVQDFISLIERLRKAHQDAEKEQEQHQQQQQQQQQDSSADDNESADRGQKVPPVIGVHCHYGYNRTGFFIVCYLVEKLDYSLEDAIQEFADQRPPGIRHEHFIDTLYVRYTIGLKRAEPSSVQAIGRANSTSTSNLSSSEE